MIAGVVHDGEPVVGYGFGASGRHDQGALMRVLKAILRSLAIPKISNLQFL